LRLFMRLAHIWFIKPMHMCIETLILCLEKFAYNCIHLQFQGFLMMRKSKIDKNPKQLFKTRIVPGKLCSAPIKELIDNKGLFPFRLK
jgi:hypothetical protein